MKNSFLVLLGLLVVSMFLLLGCAAPKYQFCCAYEQAFPENPDDAVCWGYDEEGVEQELEVVGCSENDYVCTVINNEGEEEEIPVCAYMETVPCETECAGVFCGQFFYDPRPPMGLIPDNQSHNRNFDQEDAQSEADIEDPIGMWNAQCKVEQMTPTFLRQVENSDSLVLNTFRFGVGDTFSEFEEAQYYFPLTDQACYLNSLGSVDRYVLYAIPNSVEGSSSLCSYNGNSHIYTCTKDDEIQSTSYFDCASRCALGYYGYEPEIDPFEPYNSIHDGSAVGNPFAYDPGASYDSDPRDIVSGGRGIDEVVSEFPSRSTVEKQGLVSGGGDNVVRDEYPAGVILYGATFGWDQMSFHEDKNEESFLQVKRTRDGTARIPDFYEATISEDQSWRFDKYGEDAQEYLYFDWGNRNDGWSRTVFFTQAEDSHAIYPWLLAHHSVYNKQFEDGHYLADGTHESGAEFECTSSSECLSGYCNNFDYQRGACVDENGNDVLCDCWSEGGQVLCMGAAAVDVPSWDREGVDVEVPFSLPAFIDDRQDDLGYISMPSVGRVQVITFTEDGDQDGEPIEGLETATLPMFFMYIGGMGLEYDDFDGKSRVSPDYYYREWNGVPLYEDEGDHDVEVSTIDLLMNPCAMMPEGSTNYFASNWGDEYYLSCCDGTKQCCTLGNGYDASDEDHHCEGYPFASNGLFDEVPEAGTYATRFMENCMDGYEDYVHLCYSEDAHGHVGNTWGWNMGQDTELENAIEAEAKYDHFCEYLANMRDENDKKADGFVNCYLWESGGHTPISNEDTCLMEAETFIAIEPRWVEDADEGAGRWAFGKCLLNSQGEDLEVNEYGMCESCGFLTMAKQEVLAITSTYDDGSEFWQGLFDNQDSMYGNTYCPDMVISTPFTYLSLHPYMFSYPGQEEYSDKFFYGLDAFGMNGYNQYLLGSSISRGNNDLDTCTYPNGYTVFDYDSGEGNFPDGDARQRGLPYTYPNAYYLNTQLEEMMKRNIQPVIFATDWNLWDVGVPGADSTGGMEGAAAVALKLRSDGTIDWSTNKLIVDLYDNRNYLFIGNSQTDPGNDDVIYSPGSFLANAMINEGAAIVVTYLGERSHESAQCYNAEGESVCTTFPRYNHDEIIYRGKATRLLCPNCMIAVGAGYDGGYYENGHEYSLYASGGTSRSNHNYLTSDLADGFDLSMRKKEIEELFSDEDAMGFVDVVAINVQMGDGDDYCSMQFDSDEERFEYILDEFAELGSWSLSNYGKPLIITDLTIGRGTCWSNDKAGRFMAYMGENANELAKAGYLGVIYGDWESEVGEEGITYDERMGIEGYRDSFFSGVFAAARNFAGHSFTVYYSEAEVGAASTCPCVPCSPADNPAICNGHFQGNPIMPLCEGYEEGKKWPDNCVSEDVCIFPQEGTGTQIGCKATYNDGTSAELTFDLDDIIQSPAAYQDVIGSVDFPWKLCFEVGGEEGGNAITYFVNDQNSFDPTPSVFSMEGDLEVECDPTESLLEPFCGYIPPVMDYKLECEVLP